MMKIEGSGSAHPDPLVRGMDPRIRIPTKMSWIRNTACLQEEGETEEDIEEEVGIIRVQLAYVLQQLGGRDKEAQAIYNAVLKAGLEKTQWFFCFFEVFWFFLLVFFGFFGFFYIFAQCPKL
jgi:hypothetical protein